MTDNKSTFANGIIGDLITRPEYRFVDTRVLAAVVRDTVTEIHRMREDIRTATDRRGTDRVQGPALRRLTDEDLQAMVTTAADNMVARK